MAQKIFRASAVQWLKQTERIYELKRKSHHEENVSSTFTFGLYMLPFGSDPMTDLNQLQNVSNHDIVLLHIWESCTMSRSAKTIVISVCHQ